MTRKKGEGRKIKPVDTDPGQTWTPGELSPNGTTASSVHSTHAAERDLSENCENTSRNTEICSEPNFNSFDYSVQVKTEPIDDPRSIPCSTTNREIQVFTSVTAKKSFPSFKAAKIKRERLSVDESLFSNSFPEQTPIMDLGSHLVQSLSSLKSGVDLTWSQLLEAKNLPKVHIPEQPHEGVGKTKKLKDPVATSANGGNSKGQSSSDFSFRKSSSHSRMNSSVPREKERMVLPSTGVSGSSSNRFSKVRDGGSCGSLLDLSKRTIPPHIQRVLASKYGVTKRNEEGHAAGVAPNLSKSRSRFKKTAVSDSEDEASHKEGTDSYERNVLQGFGGRTSTPFSHAVKVNDSAPKSKSVSPALEYPAKTVVRGAAKLGGKRRFSSSTYEGRKASLSPSHVRRDHQARKDDSGQLGNQRLVDLGSHYVNLLKVSPPPLSGKSSSRSPFNDSHGDLESLASLDHASFPRSHFKDHVKDVSVEARHTSPSPLEEVNTVLLRHEQERNHPEGFPGFAARNRGQVSRSDEGGEISRRPHPSEVVANGDNAKNGIEDSASNLSRRSPSSLPVKDNRGHHSMQRVNLNRDALSLSPGKSVVYNDIMAGSGQTSGGEAMIDLRMTSQPRLEPVDGRNRSRTPSPKRGGRMIELKTSLHVNSRAATAQHPVSRNASRSPVFTDQSKKSAPNKKGTVIQFSNLHEQNNRSRSPESDFRETTVVGPMIDLGSTSHLHERRGAPRMKPLNAMIDLSSVEPPNSPLSPGFSVLPFSNFPSQVYRPHIGSRSARNPFSHRAFPISGTSPGFSPRLSFEPRFNYPPSPRYRNPPSPMIDLGSSDKSGDSQRASNRATDVSPLVGHLSTSSGVSKRRHSLDSQSITERVKRMRPDVSQEQPDPNAREREVRLNVNHLLHLEQEEQKYIRELSEVQSQLIETRFKIQRLQQDLDKLESSENSIRHRIDAVRGKRLRILKDAQDKEGSQGRKNREVSLLVGNMGFRNSYRKDHCVRPGVFSSALKGEGSASEKERRLGLTVKSRGFQDEYEVSAKNKSVSSDLFGLKSSEAHSALKKTEFSAHDTSARPRDSDKCVGNVVENYNETPSDLPARSSQITAYSRHQNIYPLPSTGSPDIFSATCYPTRRDAEEEPISVGREPANQCFDRHGRAGQDNVVDARTFETSVMHSMEMSSENCTVEKIRPRVPFNSTIIEEMCPNIDAKNLKVEKSVSAEAQQFLGCLEITSTTEEPITDDDEGPKEVLAEKERESLASKLRCDQDKISTTVPSLEIKRDVAEAGTDGEMSFIGHTDAVCCILPYKGKLFSASADKSVKVFDLKTGECLKTFDRHELAVNCLQVFPGEGSKDRLFTGANDQTVRAYDMSGAMTHKFSFRGRVMCLHVAFGKLFVGLSSGFVAVIDIETDKCIDQFNCHEPSRISCLASATQGQRSLLCTGSFDSTITIRDESTGQLLRHIKDHKLTVLCMQVVENILYSGSADTVVQSHDIRTGAIVRSYTGHTMSVSGLQALGGVLVTSSLDRIIRCFDIETGHLLQLYGGNSDMIFSLCVFGDMIYTGCRDGRVSGMKLDLRKYHCCKWGDCALKFGLLNHFKQHLQDHINQTVDIQNCLWRDCCHRFPRGKQLDVIQAATSHILSHASAVEA